MARRASRVLVEFDDGSVVEKAFGSLPEPLKTELLRQPFMAQTPDSAEDGFLLLEWEDGWKEVVRVPADALDVNRYYVISRPEEAGRLSLNTKGAYPELVEIPRRPQSLARLTLADTFALRPARSEREGRKREQHYELLRQESSLGDLRRLAEGLVEQGELDPGDLSSRDEQSRERAFSTVAAGLGLRPARCRQDVLDFVARLLAEKAPSGPAADSTATAGGGQ